jgi:HPt (histidine-containing phosphotransfer) domain-containing protein
MQEHAKPQLTFDDAALTTLLELIGGDKADLVGLIDSFLAETPPLMAEMAKAAASGEGSTLRRTAHTLKSSARDFGAMALSDLCRRLEEQCRSGEAERPELQVAAIAAELEKARAALLQTRDRYLASDG